MDPKIQNSLAEARTHAHALRFVEAYNLFRRYFDRLPFQPEESHAEYISLFVRILFELGRDFDLKFYLQELEKIYDRTGSSWAAYSLAVVYSYSDTPKGEATRTLLEEVIRDPRAKALHPKARLMLADYYLGKGDVAACRAHVDSVVFPTGDLHLDGLVEVWRGVVLRREGRLGEARHLLASVIARYPAGEYWYVYFSARLIQAMVLVDLDRMEEAKEVIHETREIFSKHRFKLVQQQLEKLEALVAEKTSMGKLRLVKDEAGGVCWYADRQIRLREGAPSERLLLLLIRKGFLDKAIIVKSLYDRHYDAGHDDKLIYYHVHTLRKRLRALGLPPEAIENDGKGYRLVPEVEMVEGEW